MKQKHVGCKAVRIVYIGKINTDFRTGVQHMCIRSEILVEKGTAAVIFGRIIESNRPNIGRKDANRKVPKHLAIF